MLMWLRQLLAIAALPFTVTVLVPLWIARDGDATVVAPDTGFNVALVAGGALFLLAGLCLFATTVALFWRRGRGTLAPWDPPRVFVADGPYRYVRNPMISGVIFILIGEALVLRSYAQARWALVFFVVNLVYIPLLEEPMLEARFGESYRNYKRHVRMFIPRATPWSA